MYLSRSSWEALGLSVAIGYAALGGFATVYPSTAAKTFFNLGNGRDLWPSAAREPTTSQQVGSKGSAASAEADKVVEALMPLLGVRDMSIAAAIFTLYNQSRFPEAGSVILAGMLLCATDAVAVWNRRGPLLGSIFALGAAQWGFIGWGLQRWY